MSDKIKMEAKIFAMRKNKDEFVLSLAIHPNDLNMDLMIMPIGYRVVLELSDGKRDDIGA